LDWIGGLDWHATLLLLWSPAEGVIMGIYDGKRVFITGGSCGIGLAAALRLVRAGAHVAIAARGKERREQALAEMRAARLRQDQILLAKPLDVTDRQAVQRAATEVLSELGGVDVLVANSGSASPGWVHEIADSVFDEQIRVNYLGHVNVVRAFLPHMMAEKRGHICLVSSMLGFMGSFGYSAYCASKYAVAGFAEALRHELLPHGIRVTLFYPPTTKTPGLEHEAQTKPKAVWLYESDSGFNKVYQVDEVAQELLASIEKGRFESMVGLDSRFLFFMFRHFPRFTRWMSDGELKKAVRKAEAGVSAPAVR
jgi:3-dehydrosphinganine reductase